MAQIKKYFWLRNIALFSICGFLCFSLFPFPPIIWRLLFLLISLVTIIPNINGCTQLEKMVIGFCLLNIIYYFVSFLWLASPSTTQIGNISVTLLALPLFCILGRKGVFSERFIIIALISLVLSSMVYFESMRVIMIANFINRNDITNNASVVFLYILPFIFVLKNRYISYGVILICVYYLMEGAKRGNIVCSIPIIVLFIIMTFRNKHIKVYEKLLFIIFFFFALLWGSTKFKENEYLQKRIEQTMEGNTSNRDIIYSNCWDVYTNSEHIPNLLFGYGFDGTLNHKNIGAYAHNDWLEILVDYGVIGFIFYLLIFILIYQQIRMIREIQKRYVLIALASVWLCKTAFSMGFTEETTFILFMLFGFITQKDRKLNNSRFYNNLQCN